MLHVALKNFVFFEVASLLILDYLLYNHKIKAAILMLVINNVLNE
jgi:hypothetical protein